MPSYDFAVTPELSIWLPLDQYQSVELFWEPRVNGYEVVRFDCGAPVYTHAFDNLFSAYRDFEDVADRRIPARCRAQFEGTN